MKGPLGLGIGFKADTVNHHLIMLENEAIIPYLDFIELVYQRGIIQHLKAKDHPFFNEEYFYFYNNGGKFWIYWEISKEFEKEASSLGLNILKNLSYLYQEDKTNVDSLIKKSLVSIKTPSVSNEYL